MLTLRRCKQPTRSAPATYLTRATRVGRETLALQRRYRHHFQRPAVDLMRVCAHVTKFDLTTGNVIIRCAQWEDAASTLAADQSTVHTTTIEIARTPTTSLFRQSMRANGIDLTPLRGSCSLLPFVPALLQMCREQCHQRAVS